jgi:outer membrane protein OmpA-like peptidoglycan-associated protein
MDMGLARQSAILFNTGTTELPAETFETIRVLAGTLNRGLSAGASRVQLMAFGGGRGDKSSDARRLSLKRALVLRQILIEDGVSADRIDVRAMGGADSGPADRVDVYLKS